MQIIENGIGNLSEIDIIEINTLANTCPYSGGSAVYKARALNAMHSPNAQYNDRVLCIPQSANKMASGSDTNSEIIDQDSIDEALLLQQNGIKNYVIHINTIEPSTKEAIHKITNSPEPIITPNPSNGNITISYSSSTNGHLYIYNSVGQLIEKIHLQKGDIRLVTSLLNVSTGIYNYKFVFGSSPNTGKLTILK